MGASFYYQIKNATHQPVGLRSRLVTALLDRFGPYPWHFDEEHVEALREVMQADPYVEAQWIVDLIRTKGAVTVFVEY